MPNFKYQVLDSAGKSSSGVIDAASKNDAAKLLRADGKFITSLEVDNGGGLGSYELFAKLNTKQLVLISRQLASLLSAGVTVIRALDMLYQQVESKRAKKGVGAI